MSGARATRLPSPDAARAPCLRQTGLDAKHGLHRSHQFIRLGVAVGLGSLLALSGCVGLTPPRCEAGEKHAVSDTLYFGTATPSGIVSEEEWQDFLKVSVTPRFPDGFTAWQGAGQWKAPDGNIIRESSRVLSVLHADDERSNAGAVRVMADYKARFRQQAVLRVRSHACVSF